MEETRRSPFVFEIFPRNKQGKESEGFSFFLFLFFPFFFMGRAELNLGKLFLG